MKTWKTRSAPMGPGPLPTRLLEIYEPQKVRLRESGANEIGLYACLSYCWGKDPHNQVRTLRSNLAQYERDIEWKTLPPTFRDALELTSRLGMKYLWIDSLCIVQDDTDDWRREGGKMVTIYSNSNITFAAARSTSSEGGLFNRMSNGNICEIHRADSVFSVRIQHTDLVKSHQVSSLPLFERAWVFQERFLSPQVVHFAADELFWEDATTIACECLGSLNLLDTTLKTGSSQSVLSLTSRPKDWPTRPLYNLCGDLRKYHLKPSKFADTSKRTLWWHKIVQEYTRMHLTFESDIFPALQGVAHLMQQGRNCAYYAGLWEDSMVEDLLWYCKEPHKRPKEYRAPTWSWASVKGPVKFGHEQFWKFDCDDDEFSSFDEGLDETHKIVATVTSVSTSPVGSSSLGQLCGATMNITGMGFRFLASTGITHNKLEIVQGPSKALASKWFTWHPDVQEILQKQELIFLEMRRNSVRGQQEALCFRSVSGRGDVYERVGRLSYIVPEDHSVMEQIEITVM